MSNMRVISGNGSRLLTAVVVRPVSQIFPWCKKFTVRTMATKVITPENLNPNMVKLEYAVRGPLVSRALDIEKELEKGAKKPFDKVIKANIGDAQAMGQHPITFIRQVMACVSLPELIKDCDFPDDVKCRASEILKASNGSVGSYSSSYGMDMIRKQVACFIERRDGHPCDWQNVVISAGASTGIKNCLQMLINTIDGKSSGVMVPIPQYPLYSATISEYGLVLVGYYLTEKDNWGLQIDELEKRLCEASKKCKVRAIVIINPGNPTGQVLTRKNIEDIIKFAHKHHLLIVSDEVYQENVYAKGSKFYSFKKVLMEMGPEYKDQELASYMSVSKGYVGECGLRGGWAEYVNFDKTVQAHLYKTMSAMLCPSTIGQVVVSCTAAPPQPGDPSYDLWKKERDHVLGSLAERAELIVETFNSMPGFHCQNVQGAMYAFPSIDMPKAAIEAAKKAGQTPDVFYAFKLLEATGICVVAGSGFGQYPGTYHFRTTILPQMKDLKKMLESFRKFHEKFVAEYS